MNFRRVLGVGLLLSLVAPAGGKEPRRNSPLTLQIETTGQQYIVGHDIGLRFSLRNVSDQRVLAVRDAGLHDIVYLDVIDARGKRVSWSGRIPSRDYSQNLIVLNPGESSTFEATISDASGQGYQLQSPGKYRVRAQFSLSPRDYFTPAARGAFIPDKPVNSNWLSISIGPPTTVQRCTPKVIKDGVWPKDSAKWVREGEKSSGYSPLVSFDILESGDVANVRLKRSSGFANVDRYAMDSVRTTKYNNRQGCGVVEMQADVNIHWR
jgi:TonB family protein